MSQEIINIGNAANDGLGDSLRDAGLKINTNFSGLFDAITGSDGGTIGGSGDIIQFRRGTTQERYTYTPYIGEPVYDTTEKAFYIGDGITSGGYSPTNPYLDITLSGELFAPMSILNAAPSVTLYPGQTGRVLANTIKGFSADTITYVDKTGLSIAKLTGVSFNNITNLGSFTATSTQFIHLNYVSFPELVQVQGNITLSSNATLITGFYAPRLRNIGGSFTSIVEAMSGQDFSSLESVGGDLSTNAKNLRVMNFPELKYIGGIFQGSAYVLNGITTFNFPKLHTVGSQMRFTITGAMTSITEINFPELSYIGNAILVINVPSVVTGLYMPKLRQCLSSPNLTLPGMTDLVFGTGLKFVNGNFDASNSALSQTAVDRLLVSLAALDGTNGTISYSNRTVSINGGTSATPGAAGLTAKATLVARGCTVNNN